MSARTSSAFSARTVLALVLFGALAFVATLYFIGAGDTGGRGRAGEAHAASNALNGYSGLVKLLELEGQDVTLSRSPTGLDTSELLVLTPALYTDADEFADILENRLYRGPTLVILPKWYATPVTGQLSRRLRQDDDGPEIQDDWVQLQGMSAPGWVAELPSPYRFETREESSKRVVRWGGFGLQGSLPEKRNIVTNAEPSFETLVLSGAADALAISVIGEEGSDFYENGHSVTFVIEPDLLNNYGLADPRRAELALELVRYAGYGDDVPVVFDLSLNGFGGQANLLTLAFRPPFLAATICLILAMLVIGWRAFLRFGPPAAHGPAIAFGKRQLVANAAGLILRGRRYGLLAAPYSQMIARRLQTRLGLLRPDPGAIDAALAVRLPGEEPFSTRADSLRHARRPSEILRAANALKELERKLT